MPSLHMPPHVSSPHVATQHKQNLPQQDDVLRKAAVDLEASFLSEMLKSAGLGKSREGFGNGGSGEDQFSDFLVREQAQAIAETGGIGLAEAIYNSLKENN